MIDGDILDDEPIPEGRSPGTRVVFDMEEWKSRATLVLIVAAVLAVFMTVGHILLGLVFFGCIVVVVLISYYIVRRYPKARPLFGYVETHEGLPERRFSWGYKKRRM